MSSFEHLVSSMSCALPGDVMIDILSRLPVKTLVQYKLVSKHWCALVENRDFAFMHLRRSNDSSNGYIVITPNTYSRKTEMYVVSPTTNVPVGIGSPYEALLKSVGSCNGLICLTFFDSDKYKKSFVLCNPAIHDYKEVFPYICTRREVVWRMKSICVSLGFGFDSKANDYKIVRIEQFHTRNGQIHTECDVYSKAKDSWRNIQASLDVVIACDKNDMMTYNDGLCWTTTLTKNDDRCILVSFDIIAEIFNKIVVPKEVLASDGNIEDYRGLGYLYLKPWLDGSLLRFAHYYGTDGSEMTSITKWRLKNERWVMDPKASLKHASVRNGHYIIVGSSSLYMFDHANDNYQIVKIPEISWTNVYVYKVSLVTINGIMDRSRCNNRRCRHGLLTRVFLRLMGCTTTENIFLYLFVGFSSFLLSWLFS